MDSVGFEKHYAETELSDSMILVEEESDRICTQTKMDKCKVYHSCCLHSLHEDEVSMNEDLNEDLNEQDVEEVEEVEEEEDDRVIAGEGEVDIMNTLEEEGEEEEEEEENIELRTPEWTENRIHEEEEPVSDSDCESKCTNLTTLDDSILASQHQEVYSSEQQIVGKAKDSSDLEDATDVSSLPELIDICEKGVDTVDSFGGVQRQYNETSDETVGLLSGENDDDQGEVEEEIAVDSNPLNDNEQTINDKIEIHSKAILITLTDPLNGKKDDQMSLVTKHSAQLYRHTNYTHVPASCSISASSASSSSSTSKDIARRVVKHSGKAVKSISKKISKLFK